MTKFIAVLATPLAIAACTTMPAGDGETLGVADLRQANGQPAGTATLVAAGNSLALDVTVSGVPAGTRGFHLHTTGQCTPPGFQSAGGHLNPFNKDHGLGAPTGAHLGDLRNIDIEPNGTTTARFDLSGAREELLPYLFDSDGTSVMIHAQPDDYVTDPSGSAGERIVCGVLRRTM